MGPFSATLRESGVNQSALSKLTGITTATLRQLDTGKLASNHPYIPIIASAAKVPVDTVRSFAKGEPMAVSVAARLTSIRKNVRSGSKKKKKGVVLASKSSKPTKRAAWGSKKTRNKLKRGRDDYRQAMRATISTHNLAVMEGDDFVRIPTEALAVILTDYIERLGVKGSVILTPGFAEAFG